jgi:uncharacterized membrane protein
MNRYFLAWLVTATVMVALDLLWLGVVAKPYYQQGIGHLLAEQPRVAVIVLFYALYAVGLVVFAVTPIRGSISLSDTALNAALFGLFAYATYDLTNLATLKGWPVGLALVDIAWGTLVSAVSAMAGKWAIDRWAAS